MLDSQTVTNIRKRQEGIEAEIEEAFSQALVDVTHKVSFSKVTNIGMLLTMRCQPIHGDVDVDQILFEVTTDQDTFFIVKTETTNHNMDSVEVTVHQPVMDLQQRLILARYVEEEGIDLYDDPYFEIERIEEEILSASENKILEAFFPAVKQAVSQIVEKVVTTLSAKAYAPYYKIEEELQDAMAKVDTTRISNAWVKFRGVLDADESLNVALHNEVGVMDDFCEEINKRM